MLCGVVPRKAQSDSERGAKSSGAWRSLVTSCLRCRIGHIIHRRYRRWIIKENAASLYILTALGAGPLHGLGIAEAVARFTGEEVLLGPGTLYRCLKELTNEGWIVRAEGPRRGRGPGRKYYRLTELGRRELAGATHRWGRLVRAARRGLQGLDPAGAA